MVSKLITRGDSRDEVRFRFSKKTADELRKLKDRVKEQGYTLTIDDEVERATARIIARAVKELDTIATDEEPAKSEPPAAH